VPHFAAWCGLTGAILETVLSSGGKGPAGWLGVWVAAVSAAIAGTTAIDAHADENELNYLAGPVLGFTFGDRSGAGGGLLGLEAGAGWGPERVNIGIEQRDDESFGYVELDPW